MMCHYHVDILLILSRQCQRDLIICYNEDLIKSRKLSFRIEKIISEVLELKFRKSDNFTTLGILFPKHNKRNYEV